MKVPQIKSRRNFGSKAIDAVQGRDVPKERSAEFEFLSLLRLIFETLTPSKAVEKMLKNITILSALLLLSCSSALKNRPPTEPDLCIRYQVNRDPSALEVCQERCDLKNATACTVIGTMYQRGELVEASHTEALKFAGKGCSLGDPAGCYYGGLWRRATDDQKVRVASFEEACNSDQRVLQADRQFACFEAAKAHVNGFGVPVNRDHGLKLADIACQAGNEDACDGVYDRPAIFAEPEPSKVKPIEDNRVQFTSSLVEAGPMKLKNVVCKFDNGAMTVPLNMVDTLAKHKPRFDACGAKMDVAMSWSVQLGALPVVDVESTEEKVGECVKHVFSSIEGLPFGVCSAELPPSVTAEVETPDVKKK